MPDNEPTPNQSTAPPAPSTPPTPPPAPIAPVPTQPASAPSQPAPPVQATAPATKKKGSIWKWIILYGIVAVILYTIVFLLFFAGHSAGTASSIYNY